MIVDRARAPRCAHHQGFSLVELMVVIAVGAIIAAMTVPTVVNVLKTERGDSAMMQVAAILRQGREASIGQRRSIDVVFNGTANIQLIRNNVPNGTTLIGQATLENGVVMMRDVSIPDTPDTYGAASATDFDNANIIRFQPDGMLTDGAGVPINGTVFFGRAGEPTAYRAVTVTGSSGRAQPYRWTGSRWEAR